MEPNRDAAVVNGPAAPRRAGRAPGGRRTGARPRRVFPSKSEREDPTDRHGSAIDAEDVVQDAWLRWSAVDESSIRDSKAWLSVAVVRLCLDSLKSARSRHESYVGTCLPEPVVMPQPRGPPPRRIDARILLAFGAALRPVRGRDNIARFFAGLVAKEWVKRDEVTMAVQRINGWPALVARVN